MFRFAVLLGVAVAALAQQSVYTGDQFSGSGSPAVSEGFAGGCTNRSPYAGMNPLTCYGISQPVDNYGQCSLRGVTLLRRVGNTCYYCQPINPPIQGTIIPLDQLQQARQQGFTCGYDQADPNCSAVCRGGTRSYVPPAGQPANSRPKVPLTGGVTAIGGDPCRPFGPGGYDYCANPTQPPGCVCPKNQPVGSSAGNPPSCQAPDWVREYQAEGANPPLRYQVGFNQGVARCLQNQCSLFNLSVAMWASAFKQVGAVLAIRAAYDGLIELAVNRPGFSRNPDPYLRGKEEGTQLCNFAMKVAVVGNFRSPLSSRGRLNVPRGFNFYQAFNEVAQWLPRINPGRGSTNCVYCTVNTLRVFAGQPVEPAPAAAGPATVADMESSLGTKFESPVTLPQLNRNLSLLQEGQIGALRWVTPGSDVGHVVTVVRANGNTWLLDGQNASRWDENRLPSGNVYSLNMVGNVLNGN